jgi:hypothetical protein
VYAVLPNSAVSVPSSQTVAALFRQFLISSKSLNQHLLQNKGRCAPLQALKEYRGRRGTHEIGGWVILSAGVDFFGEEKISYRYRDSNRRQPSPYPSRSKGYIIPVHIFLQSFSVTIFRTPIRTLANVFHKSERSVDTLQTVVRDAIAMHHASFALQQTNCLTELKPLRPDLNIWVVIVHCLLRAVPE